MGSLVLDAGAGDQPYAAFFKHCRYEAADFEKVDKDYAKSTYVCDLVAIPVEDGRFDAVLFNQVMEHLPEPLIVLRELNRVMRSGARMIATAPLFYEEHEQPFDFYRYTQFGWQHLMTEAGFEIESLTWMDGYLATVAYQLETAQKYLPRKTGGGLIGWLAIPILVACKLSFGLLAQFFYRLDERQKYTASGYPKNYLVVVRKP